MNTKKTHWLTLMFAVGTLSVLLSACKGDKGDPGIEGPDGNAISLFKVGQVSLILTGARYMDDSPVGNAQGRLDATLMYSKEKDYYEWRSSSYPFFSLIECSIMDSTGNTRMMMEINFLQSPGSDIEPEFISGIYINIEHDKRQGNIIRRWSGAVNGPFNQFEDFTIDELYYDSSNSRLHFRFSFTFDYVSSAVQPGNPHATKAAVEGDIRVLPVMFRQAP